MTNTPAVLSLKGENMGSQNEWKKHFEPVRGWALPLRMALGGMLVILIFAAMALAQRTTGGLRGQVLDPQGAVVANAKVTVTNQATGVAQDTQTTSAGTYNFPSLLPGAYTVTVEATGFAKYTRKDISVLADQQNEANAKLNVGATSETVEVVGGAEAVQTTSSSLNSNYDARAVVNLPNAGGALNGSPLNLAVLSPNVTAQPGGVQGVGGSVGGTRPRDNNFTVDGIDDNNLGVTGPNSTVIPDAVGEFAVQTNQFSAEYGHSAGGQFNLVTKTGTNNWHGSGEWYFQNRNLNAIDNLTHQAIDNGTIPGQPAYDNNRFGGTIGGPLMKNKWFIFGAYEYTTLHGQGTPTALRGPTAAGLASLEAMAANPSVANVLANLPVASSSDQTVSVNGQDIPIGDFVSISPVFQREHDFQINSDYTRGKHQFGVRFLFNQEKFILPVNSTQAQFNQLEPVRNRKLNLTDTWTINDHWVNELRLGYSYFSLALQNPCSACPPDVTIGELGFNTIGPGDNQFQRENAYQILDNVSWAHGKHTFKFGGEYIHYIYPQFFLPRSNGDYWYFNLETLVNDLTPDVPGRNLRNAGSGTFLGTQSAIYGFVQDDFKVTPRLTLNLGLRYEFWTNPVGGETQALNAISNVPGVISFNRPEVDYNNIGPRVGFAWDPTGSGKTSVRGGFGVSYDVKFQNFASITLPPQLQSELDPTSACTLTPTPGWCATNTNFLANGGLPQTYVPPTSQLDARGLTTSFIDDTVMSKIMSWSLGVQRELYRGGTLEVRYLGTRGLELPVQYRRNRRSAFDAGITPLPTFLSPSDVPATWNASTPTDVPFNNFDPNTYAQYGFIANVTADPPLGSSNYHGLSFNFTQSSRHGLTFNANYTYSHAIDDATNEFFTSFLNPRRAQDTNQIGQDRASSDLDVRHKFAFWWTYDIPKFKTENKYLKALVNGYQLGSTFLAQTGQPVTLQSGVDANGNGDTAGDRVVLNPNGSALRGSDVASVCAAPGGTTYVAATSLGNGGDCTNPVTNTLDPAIGYLALDTGARFVVAGPGVRTTVGRNSLTTPGFGVWNLSIFKNTHFTESKYLQIRAEFFNVLNHPNYSLSNGNVFNVAGITTATSTPGYVQVLSSDFLNPKLFSGGFRNMTLGLKLVF
jgi:hypothetical protein